MTQHPTRYDHFRALGLSGTAHDVDVLMHALRIHEDIATSRLVDFALGLVDTRAGVAQLRHYLFHGAPIQRNYAALYFKRRGRTGLLEEAVAQGKIDAVQAHAQ